MNLGVIGYSFLGKAFEYAFQTKNKIMINDIAKPIDMEKFFPKQQLVKECDIIFIGLPTPYSKSKGYIPHIIDAVMDELDYHSEVIGKKQIVCIKSAVLPTHVISMIAKYKNLDIVISPEYLSGKDSIRDMINCDILICGGNEDACDKVIDLFVNHSVVCKTLKIGKCSAVDASMIKYMENCFLALKCVFMSEMYLLHEKVKSEDSVDFDEVLKQWMFDSRMGEYPYHIPYFGELGFDSHCLCKDHKSIIDEANKFGVSLDLMKSMSSINEKLRGSLEAPHTRCENTSGGVVK